jgi:hypothetical protein
MAHVLMIVSIVVQVLVMDVNLYLKPSNAVTLAHAALSREMHAGIAAMTC